MTPKAENWIKFWCAPQLGGRVELSRGIGVTHVYPWHWHEEVQISAIESGSDDLSFQGAEHHMLPGALSFMPPGEVHSNRHSTSAGCTYRNLNVGPDLLIRAFGGLTMKEATFSLKQPVLLDSDLFRQFIATHARLEEMPSRLVSDVLLLRLLEAMLRRTSGMRRHAEGYGREERLAVRRVREYLVEAYAENVSLDDLAKVANLSPYHLHRVFTREVGISPHAFQTQVRISRAKDLMNEGRPLHMVATETGFSDQSHFTREFKRYMGLTPGAYRSNQPLPASMRPARITG
ncbi:MAG TPA: AraC family transcriptional regulator [Thermoanaerobaculia bacterium]|jgi:AraC-like DNA-binding protein|nr:AraC family transcriptional regulator [Thermoanaerobaculia bacterium]